MMLYQPQIDILYYLLHHLRDLLMLMLIWKSMLAYLCHHLWQRHTTAA